MGTYVKALIGVVAVFLSNFISAAEFERIGRFDFPTSASGAAQEHFLLGVGYLHSFGWKQAREEFRKAQDIEPDFALAYWGESLTYNHPLIPVLQDPDSPKETLLRLGRNSEERLAKAPTRREKGFLKAAEAFAFTNGPLGEKRLAWMQAMLDLYDEFPEDREVSAFTAVAMLSGATAAKDGRVLNNFLTESGTDLSMQAGAIAIELFRENPNHPGAAHYIIHSFDHPTYAPLALVAAEKYASIAPAVSHAQHMPTHIFIQHGMWNKVSEWNDSAFQAAWDLWEEGDSAGDQNHSSDWGQYGDLQQGNFERSQLWISRAGQVLAKNSDSRSRSTLKTMKARHIIETEEWEIQELEAAMSSDELLALGMGAINLGNITLAKSVSNRLHDLVTENPNDVTLKLIDMEVSSLLKFENGDREGAIALIMEAVAIAESLSPPRGAANPLQPVHELAGELFYKSGDYEAAVDLFESSLDRMPNRPKAILGAARSYAGMGKVDEAKDSYKAFEAIRGWTNTSEANEAKNYIGS